MTFRFIARVLAVVLIALCVSPVTAPFSVWDTAAPVSPLHEASLSAAKLAQQPPAIAVGAIDRSTAASVMASDPLTLALWLTPTRPRPIVLRI